jgi:hypothetical protein
MLPDDDRLPLRLAVNASDGRGTLKGGTSGSADRWTINNAPPAIQQFLSRPELPDETRWEDERVGWGIVLPERENFSHGQMADLVDVEEPIRELVSARANSMGRPVPVFRFRRQASDRFRLLRDYRNEIPVPITGSRTGVAPGAVPGYLLICGHPTEIPWELQYILNTRASSSVGRLRKTRKAQHQSSCSGPKHGSRCTARCGNGAAKRVGTRTIAEICRRMVRSRRTVMVPSRTL